MTLNDIRSAAAAYLHRTVPEFTINGVDLSLFALNQVRQAAELQNDFNFTRRLLSLDVDGVTGGSLSDAVTVGTIPAAPFAGSNEIKTVIDVGQFDADGNLVPLEWTTVAAGLDVQRAEGSAPFRYPTDGQAVAAHGLTRLVFSGNSVYLFPKVKNQPDFTIGIEAYTFSVDWVVSDYSTTPNPWATKGAQYLLWATIIQLNQVYKDFVFRQEGNLPPPQTLVDQGLASLVTWDVFKYEQSRRHNR